MRKNRYGYLEEIFFLGTNRYKVDFSYLGQYENVHFIISLQPQIRFGTDFDVVFPKEQIFQYYQILKSRHRHTKKILEFLDFYHENNSSSRTGLLRIHLDDDDLTEESQGI